MLRPDLGKQVPEPSAASVGCSVVQNCYKGSESLPYLQPNELGYQTFIDTGRRHKTPGSVPVSDLLCLFPLSHKFQETGTEVSTAALSGLVL